MFHRSGLLVALVSLVAHVVSPYIMDDRNATISYSPSNMVDQFTDSQAYDSTLTLLGYHVFGCLTSDNCQMGVPFTGSGITLYAAIAYALSFDISIDGTAFSQSHFDGVYDCCNDTFPPVYNFTIYDIQNLPLGNHFLVLRLLNTSGHVFHGNPGSTLDFDYIVVNETATPPSPSPSPVPPSPHQRLGPALGGALGGTAALALAALAVIYIRRRAHKGGAEDPDTPIIVSDKQEQDQPVITAGLYHDPAPVSSIGEGSNARATAEHQLYASDEVPLTATPFTISTSPLPPHHGTPTPPTHEIRPTVTPFAASTSHSPPHNWAPIPPMHEVPPTAPPFTTSTSHPPLQHETPTPPTSSSREEEESLLLARMYSLNVPTAEIARVMDAMRAQRQAAQAGQAEGSSAPAARVNSPQPPPYEL